MTTTSSLALKIVLFRAQIPVLSAGLGGRGCRAAGGSTGKRQEEAVLVWKKIAWLAPLALLLTVPAKAQDPRFELRGWAGYTFSDGVSGDAREGSDGNVYTRVDPRNSGSYGFSAGFFVTEMVEIGFLWDRQDTVLEAKGTAVREVSDLNVDNYHGYLAYNFGEVDDVIRPYVLAGLGVTRFSNIVIRGLAETRTIPSDSRFSTTWGVGLKIYPTRNLGLFAAGRWTPTWIKTDAAGWWCDPWWGCWVVGNTQYANQIELEAGLTFRF
jgi:opacity protein-like surface antigen